MSDGVSSTVDDVATTGRQQVRDLQSIRDQMSQVADGLLEHITDSGRVAASAARGSAREMVKEAIGLAIQAGINGLADPAQQFLESAVEHYGRIVSAEATITMMQPRG